MRAVTLPFFAIALVCALSACNSEPHGPASEATSAPDESVQVVADAPPAIDPATLSGDDSKAGVAIIDLDGVAKRLGRLDSIAASIKEKETYLNDKLALLQSAYRRQLEAKQAEFGEQPDEEQSQELLDLQRLINTNIAKVRVHYQQELAQYKNSVKQNFQQEVRPVARALASEQGMSVVIQQNYVFTSVDGVDITAAVAERMLADSAKTKDRDKPIPKVSELPVRDSQFKR